MTSPSVRRSLMRPEDESITLEGEGLSSRLSSSSSMSHDRTGKLVVCRDTRHYRTWQHVVKRDTRHELNHGPVGCRSSNTRRSGCVFQDVGAAEVVVNLTEELRHAETDPTCKIHQSYCASHKNSRPKILRSE